MASHWTCRLALALLWLGLSGCPGDTFIDCIPPPLPNTEPEPAPGIVVTGQRVRMRVTPTGSAVSCVAQEDPSPTSVTAEIEGPGGEPLANQITLGQFRAPALLEFTPERPGPHHLVVTFSQVGGLHQFDLHAAHDRSAEAPSESLSLTCDALERASTGAWTCGSSVLGGSTGSASFSGAQLAVARDVIWVVDSSSVRRYVHTGTTLVLSASFSHTHSGAEFLLASPDELLVLHSYSLGYYTFSGGQLTSPSSQTWARPIEPVNPKGPYGVLMRDADRLALVTRTRNSDSSLVQVCTYRLISGQLQPPLGTCPSVSGELIGFEPGVLWTRDLPAVNSQGLNQGLIRRWVWTGGQLLEQGSLSLGPHASILERPLRRWNPVPLVHNLSSETDIQPVTAVLTWSPQKQAIFLEHLDATLTDVYASPSFYWGRDPSAPAFNSTKVRLRPPPQ